MLFPLDLVPKKLNEQSQFLILFLERSRLVDEFEKIEGRKYQIRELVDWDCSFISHHVIVCSGRTDSMLRSRDDPR